MSAKKGATKSLLVVNIEKGKSDSNGLFFPIYSVLVEKLKAHPTLHVEFIDSIAALQSKCIEYNPMTTVLLFTNELVTENDILGNIVQSFVKGGALAIFGCLFASFAKPDHEIKLFTSLGLPWKVGSFDSGKCVVSPVGRFLLADYEEQFYAKAHMLTNVSQEQKLYTQELSAMAQRTALSEPIDTSGTMAAFAKLGVHTMTAVLNS